jgi:ACS family hexuronate transporter-like MFS transporter
MAQYELRWLWQMAKQRRFWVLIFIVIAINLTWHFFRVWLPLFLKEHHQYSDDVVQNFSTAYYIAADAGSVTGGFMALWLARHGWPVHASRTAVFAACSLLAILSLAVAYVDAGVLLLILLMLLGFGALGVFPVYYSFSQELTVKDQGRLTGTLSFVTWMASARMHPIVGEWLDNTKDWSSALALAGLPPFLGLIVLLLFWGRMAPATDLLPRGRPLNNRHDDSTADKIEAR